jgi:hypothetical protein
MSKLPRLGHDPTHGARGGQRGGSRYAVELQTAVAKGEEVAARVTLARGGEVWCHGRELER